MSLSVDYKMKNYIISILLFGFGYSTVINIPSDYSTIQEGLDASVEGDTVLVSEGEYFENLILDKEIILASHAIYDQLDTNWISNQYIVGTIINGGQHPIGSNKGSCLIIRDNDINPLIFGFTFKDGTGSDMLIIDCEVTDDHQRIERSGGGILAYKAYPDIMYNKFINNGNTSMANIGDETLAVTNGGAISHYDTDDVEFDEDRNGIDQNINQDRNRPNSINIQNNYFENNGSGDGECFYSNGFLGTIDLSNSIFDNIDCSTSTVNEFILKSKTRDADYIQEGITGTCIEQSTYYVNAENGNDNNPGTEEEPFLTIRKVLGLAKEDGSTTFINVAEGRYSPSTTGESFPLIIPDNIHLIGANWENTIIDIEATQDKQARGFIVQEVINVKIANFTITGGSAEDAGCQGGGAILLTNNDDAVYNADGSWAPYAPSTPVLENLYLTGNHAYNGGGIGVFRIIGPTMENIIVEENSSYSFGGGVFHHAGVTTISNAKITNNNALTEHGGGIAVFAGGTVLNNVEISHNTAEFLGGGAAIYESEVDLFNTTFSNNIDHANNSAIWSMNSTVGLVNSIVWDNQPNQLEGAYTITYSNIPSNTQIFGDGEGNINTDPLFVDPGNGDFTLSDGSPCIDTGTADIDGDGEEDITDYIGSSPDMGAYETTIDAPTGFTIYPVETYVVLTWDSVTDDDFEYFILERSTNIEFTEDINSEALITIYFEDDDLEYDTEYFYRLYYVSGGDNSEYSDILSVTLDWMSVEGDQLPKTYALHQNYPNPFNPITTLRYGLPEDAMVNITIYDMMGRVVSNLVNNQQYGGYKSVKWNATNNQGEPVSAGVYLYKIQAGDFVDTRKMILLK